MPTSVASDSCLPFDEVLLDTRSSAHFHGWPERGDTLGGHLPGALHLDAAWLEALTDDALRALLAERGIELQAPLIPYGAGAETVATRLKALGARSVEARPSALKDALSGGLTPIALARFSSLVPVTWLSEVLDAHSPPFAPSHPPLLIEVGWQTESDYLAGHLPGALYLDTARVEEAPTWTRVSDARLKSTLLSLGIHPSQPVVVYGEDTLAPARLAHLLLYAGVRDVRLLEGGKGAWRRAGLPLEAGALSPRATPRWEGRFPARPELCADTEQVRARLGDPAEQVLSVRSWPEYLGETSGYPYIEARGHLPGAQWAYGGSDAHHLEDFRNPDETMRSGIEIAARWRACGITPERRTTLYCGTAWRASEVFFYAWVMGWSRLCVYDGGWRTWTHAPSYVAATGPSAGEAPKQRCTLAPAL